MTESKQPWQTLAARLIYDNAWIRVEEHDVINPSGATSIYGKVCFKNLAVAIVALDEAENLVLVGQHRYTLGEYSWELPMGGAPATETPLGAAQRELKEETGVHAQDWREVKRLHTSNSITDELALVYLARELTNGEPQFEATEDLRIRKLPLTEAVRWVLDGRITDAVSAAGILKVWTDRDAFLS
jgi:8-oxo-dGTP pyrophosphatase MutT (NUDIX family)